MGDAGAERYRLALNALSSYPNVGIILVTVLLQTSYIESDVVDAITESQVTYGKVAIVCTVGGDFAQTLAKCQRRTVYHHTKPLERAVNVMNALIK